MLVMASLMVGFLLLGPGIANQAVDNKLSAQSNIKFVAFAPPLANSFARRPLPVQPSMLKNGQMQRQWHVVSNAAAAGADYQTYQKRYKSLLAKIQTMPAVDMSDTGRQGLQDDETIAVVLLNLGGPDSLEDVQPFLKKPFLG
jgi:hypothetical protein